MNKIVEYLENSAKEIADKIYNGSSTLQDKDELLILMAIRDAEILKMISLLEKECGDTIPPENKTNVDNSI